MFSTRLRRTVRALALVTSLAAASSAHAGPFDALYVFGDSLSDNGSDLALSSAIHALNPAFPITPGAGVGGHFSNGRVAVDGLALRLGLPLTPHYLTPPFLGGAVGGTNYAQGGAFAGLTNAVLPGTLTIGGSTVTTGFKGVRAQVNDYLGSTPAADPNALYVVWSGANDILFYGSAPVLPSCAAATNPFICTAVSNTASSIAALLGAGAKHILVPNLPDIGKTPSAITGGTTVVASALSSAFNAGLASAIAGFNVAFPGDVTLFDTFSLLNDVIANASAYGFTDVTHACLSGSVSDAASTVTPACAAAGVGSYLWYDSVHPTTRAHDLLAVRLAAAVGVPEPETVALFALGLIALGVARRRRA